MATENYLLSVQGSVNGQYNECVMCFQSSGLATNDTLSAGKDLINAFIAHGKAAWLACLPGTYFLSLMTARRAFPKPSAVAHAQPQAFSDPGTRSGSATSYNLCPSVFLVPPMGTKSGGRVFMPAVAQGDVINNAYLTAYANAVTTFFASALVGFAGSGTNWQLAIYSRKNRSAALCNSFGLSERLGFQSRRRRPTGAA